MHRTYAPVLALACGVACAGGAEAASYQVLYSFQGGSDGSYPLANLVNVGGTLYGTTSGGGAFNGGTVFSLNLTTGAEKVVYSFGAVAGDGSGPVAGLIDVRGTLYGTTQQGGVSAHCPIDGGTAETTCGTVFSFNPTTGVERVLYSFQNGSDGAYPEASLIKVGETLYGTTQQGGSGAASCITRDEVGDPELGCGTVFSLNLKTGAEKVLYAFQGGSDGAYPDASLIDVGGTLYGTTSGSYSYLDGAPEPGTVFSLNLATGAEKVVHSFTFTGSGDGYDPNANLLNVGGTLYGTTTGGGASGYSGHGTVFSLNLRSGSETVVYSFGSHSMDGGGPYAGLAKLGAKLYGTNETTVFSLSPTTGAEKVLHTFSVGGGDGVLPKASLINVGGTLYGTTFLAGSFGHGTIFALTP